MMVNIWRWCKNLAANYVRMVQPSHLERQCTPINELTHWKIRLFGLFLLFCFPVSLIAVVPGVYVSFKEGYTYTGLLDLACFLFICFVTFSQRLAIQTKKYCILGMFYVLAIFLTSSLGYIGPGVLYMLAITVFTSLFLPIRNAYYSIIANALIMIFFAAEIHFRIFPSSLLVQYTSVQWIAFSSNLIFIGIITVLLIEKIFQGLQTTIESKEVNRLKYQTIFDHSPMPMWLFDVHTLRFLDVNHAAIAQYGYTKSEFLAMTIKDIRPLENAGEIEQIVLNNRQAYKFYEEGFRHKRKNGEEIIVSIESSLIEYNGNEAKLVLATDITNQIKSKAEAMEANEKVVQSEFNLRAIFESTQEGFILLNQEDRIVVSNQKAIDFIISGRQVTELKAGDNIFKYVDGDRVAEFQACLDKVRSGNLVEYDRKYTLADRIFWIHYTLTPALAGGQITGTCITGRDVTGLKVYLEKIEEQNRTFREISWLQSHVARAPLARIMGLANLIITEKNEQERLEMIKLLELTTKEFDDAIKDITCKIARSNEVHDSQTLHEQDQHASHAFMRKSL